MRRERHYVPPIGDFAEAMAGLGASEADVQRSLEPPPLTDAQFAKLFRDVQKELPSPGGAPRRTKSRRGSVIFIEEGPVILLEDHLSSIERLTNEADAAHRKTRKAWALVSALSLYAVWSTIGLLISLWVIVR